MPARIKVPKGTQFDRLTVIKEIKPNMQPSGTYVRMFKCKCSCEKQTIIKADLGHLRSGHTTSCGCKHKAVMSKKSKGSGRYHPLYNRWRWMDIRCYNKNFKQYPDYGGRGIRVCKKWRKIKGNNVGFWAFVAWNESLPKKEQFRPELQINRINNDGNYKPLNCNWVTPKENMQNISTTKRYKFKGEHLTIHELIIKYGVNGLTKSIFRSRRYRGWKVKAALTTPIRK